ncbi:MAG: hypothetical protein AAFX06_26470 [Planctomycetota bacterium]
MPITIEHRTYETVEQASLSMKLRKRLNEVYGNEGQEYVKQFFELHFEQCSIEELTAFLREIESCSDLDSKVFFVAAINTLSGFDPGQFVQPPQETEEGRFGLANFKFGELQKLRQTTRATLESSDCDIQELEHEKEELEERLDNVEEQLASLTSASDENQILLDSIDDELQLRTNRHC